MGLTTEFDRDQATRALAQAASAAAMAPSIHNTQPWRWRVRDGVADLYADTRRHLPATDPERRLLMLSCGAALHQASVALAAGGVAAETVYFPDASNSDHLARVTATGRTAVTPAAMRLFQTMEIRHTDRRPLLDEPVPATAIEALRAAAAAYRTGLDVLSRDQVIELASATARAQRDEVDDYATRAELDAWTGEHRPANAGIPNAAIPERAPMTTVPARDFGHIGELEISDAHDRAAAYAILYGVDDEPGAWLRAGEALSAVWLVATEHDVAVLPLSAAVESPTTRQALRRILAGVGYPYIAVRLGIADPDRPMPSRTPRLPADATVEVIGG